MAWNYAYQAGVSGSLEDVPDFMDGVRIVPVSTVNTRTIGNVVPHRPGIEESVTEFYGVGTFQIKGQLRGTNSAGAVTHADGAAGHYYDNLSNVRRIFTATRDPIIVQQTAPDHGVIQIRVRPAAPVTGAENNPHSVTITCRAVWPFWRSTTQSSATGTSVVVAGDAPISDMILELDGNGKWTHNQTGDYVEILSGGATIINCANRTILTNPGGVDNAKNFVTNVPWWMYWDVGTQTFTKTTTGTFKWNNSYR